MSRGSMGCIGETKLFAFYCEEGLDKKTPMCELGIEKAQKIYASLFEAHKSGLQHNNLGEEHIRWFPDGNACIISWGLAKAHQCEREREVAPYTIVTAPWNFGCEELFEEAHYMRLITIPHFRAFGDTVHISQAWTAEMLTESAVRQDLYSWKHPDKERIIEQRCKMIGGKAQRIFDAYSKKYEDRWDELVKWASQTGRCSLPVEY